jgi:hypothetical protein
LQPSVAEAYRRGCIAAETADDSNDSDDDVDDDDDDDDDDDNGDASASASAVPAGIAALHAAALVNRLWFAAAVPLMWQQPTEEALATDAVTTPARRAWYASYIQKVHVSGPSPLWRALARYADHDGGQPARSDVGGCNGARPTALHVKRFRSPVARRHSRYGQEFMQSEQAQLTHYITAGLGELSCFLTADVMGRLEALPTQPAAVGQAGSAARTCDGRLKAINMRKLHLYGAEALAFMVGVPVNNELTAAERRLLEWLDQAPSNAPGLKSLRLHFLFSSSFTTEAFDRVFRGLALHGALEELVLDRCGFVGQGAVSRAAIEHLASAVRHSRLGLNVADEAGPRHDEQHGQKRASPFLHLKVLSVAIQSHRSTASLALLLPAIRRLSLAVRNRDDGDLDEGARQILQPLSTLRQLRALHLDLLSSNHIAGSDIRLLSDLAELRELRLVGDFVGDALEADVAHTLAALRRLHTLSLFVNWEEPAPHLLRVIGEACPRLRRLTVLPTCCLGPSLDTAQAQPLFPCLEVFEVVMLTMIDDTMNDTMNDTMDNTADDAADAPMDDWMDDAMDGLSVRLVQRSVEGPIKFWHQKRGPKYYVGRRSGDIAVADFPSLPRPPSPSLHPLFFAP